MGVSWTTSRTRSWRTIWRSCTTISAFEINKGPKGPNPGRLAMRLIASLALAFAALFGTAAQAEDISVKIGVLTDFSGLYTDDTGLGSVAAGKKAVEDFYPAAQGKKVGIISAHQQNKPGPGSSIARQWFDV